VADVSFQNLHDAARPQFYIPLEQGDVIKDGPLYIVIRAMPGTAGVREVAANARAVLRGAHPGIRTLDVKPFLDLLDPEIRPFRLGAMMFGVFGGLALLLAGVGLYAVISFGVARRTREIGIRNALGARPGDVVGLVLGEGVRVTLVGVVHWCRAGARARARRRGSAVRSVARGSDRARGRFRITAVRGSRRERAASLARRARGPDDGPSRRLSYSGRSRTATTDR
jgi:hypothetical protein